MTVEQAIRDHLVADSGVRALVSTRVWQLILPQGGVLPAVRVQLIDQPRRYHLRGGMHLTRSRVQVDVWARRGPTDAYDVAADVHDAIEAALTPAPFSVGSPALEVAGVFRVDRAATFDKDEIDAVRIRVDYMVEHRAA